MESLASKKFGEILFYYCWLLRKLGEILCDYFWQVRKLGEIVGDYKWLVRKLDEILCDSVSLVMKLHEIQENYSAQAHVVSRGPVRPPVWPQHGIGPTYVLEATCN